MSILIKGLKMPKEYEFIDLVITGDGVVREYYTDKVDIAVAEAVELPDHGDLIDKDALYERTEEWEAQALAQIKEYCCGESSWEQNECRKWATIVSERSAFKFDVADAPVVIPAERTADLCDACGKADKGNCSYCEKMERSESDGE